jgi:hypothetical protein
VVCSGGHLMERVHATGRSATQLAQSAHRSELPAMADGVARAVIMSFGDGGRGQPSGTRRPVDGIAVLLVTMTAAASTSYRAGQGQAGTCSPHHDRAAPTAPRVPATVPILLTNF